MENVVPFIGLCISQCEKQFFDREKQGPATAALSKIETSCVICACASSDCGSRPSAQAPPASLSNPLTSGAKGKHGARKA